MAQREAHIRRLYHRVPGSSSHIEEEKSQDYSTIGDADGQYLYVCVTRTHMHSNIHRYIQTHTDPHLHT